MGSNSFNVQRTLLCTKYISNEISLMIEGTGNCFLRGNFAISQSAMKTNEYTISVWMTKEDSIQKNNKHIVRPQSIRKTPVI